MAEQGATREGVLNVKQLRFVEEYLVDLNASQAAARAGYSKRTAGAQGHRLLKDAEIQAAIQAQMRQRSASTGITIDRVVKELARLAFADTRRLYHEDGRLKLPHEIDDDTAAALAAMESLEVGGSDGPPLAVKKVKLWDKRGALESLLKHLGASGEKPPADPSAALAALPSAVEALAAKLDKLVPLKAAA